MMDDQGNQIVQNQPDSNVEVPPIPPPFEPFIHQHGNPVFVHQDVPLQHHAPSSHGTHTTTTEHNVEGLSNVGQHNTEPIGIDDWDDGWNLNNQMHIQQHNYGYGPGYGYPLPPHHPYQGNPHAYHPNPPFNAQPHPINHPYGDGIQRPPPPQNMGVPIMNNRGLAHAQGADAHFRPALTINSSPVVAPIRQGRSFEVRPAALTALPTFHGRATEEPYQHLRDFEQTCQIIGGQGFSPDEVKLILFPFSLKDRAKEWFSALPAASIFTWADMQQQFLNEFYTMKKTTEARAAIRNFKQQGGELFHEAFTRFKDMLRKCPHHGIDMWELLTAFYDGLSSKYIRDVTS